MTALEKAKYIIENGDCSDIVCNGGYENECPAYEIRCEHGASKDCKDACIAYISEHDTPSLEERIAKLEKIVADMNAEAEEEKAVAKKKTVQTIKFDDTMSYVFKRLDGSRYILIGIKDIFAWINLQSAVPKYFNGATWNSTHSSGQIAIDSILGCDGCIIGFNDPEEASKFCLGIE